MKRAAWLTLALAWAGCSWLVDPNEKAALCSTEENASPCAKGFACVDGHCEPSPEGCDATDRCGDMEDNDCDGKVDEEPNLERKEACGNGQDDDCDGKIDEEPDPSRAEACGNSQDDDCDGKTDEGHDQDSDGNQWCGDTRKPASEAHPDCDDYDPNVHYGAEERCDGVDNDCDDTVDERSSASLCPAGEECVAQRCVVPSCAVEGSSAECGPDQMCDLNTGKCVDRACSDEECQVQDPLAHCDVASGECRTERRNNGDECAAHGDCKSGSCVDAASMRLIGNEARGCGQACCSDVDCVKGERCFASGSGSRSCLPNSLAPDPGGPDLCTNDTQCAGTPVCSVQTGQRIQGPSAPRNNLITTVCALPLPGATAAGSDCLVNTDCASNACVFDPADPFNDVCSAICRTSGDCTAVAAGAEADTGVSVTSYCRYLQATAGSTRGDYVSVCVMDRGDTGSGGVGAPCSNTSDCADGACVGAGAASRGSCAPTCCTDAQCPDVDGSATFCRPIAFGDHYEMRCVR